MTVRTLIFASLFGLAACAAPSAPVNMPAVELTPEIAASAIEGVKSMLKDPYSADVRPTKAVREPNGTIGVCGLVNAKNSYGGYVGDKFFYAMVSEITDGSSGPKFISPGAILEPSGESGFAVFRMRYPVCVS